jgi:hypothetical protein
VETIIVRRRPAILAFVRNFLPGRVADLAGNGKTAGLKKQEPVPLDAEPALEKAPCYAGTIMTRGRAKE